MKLIVGCMCLVIASGETILKEILHDTLQGVETSEYSGADLLDQDIILTAAKWGMYKLTYNKNYDQETDHKKFKTFLLNSEKIRKHNEKFKNNEVSYTVKINRFTDLTVDEAIKMFNGFKGNTTVENLVTFVPTNETLTTLEPTFDWRSKGAISPIKDQGRCGSCWAFSATGALESANFLRTGVMSTISEQELLDCTGYLGNNGCVGGNMINVFEHGLSQGGITSDSDYPYEAAVKSCRNSDLPRFCGMRNYNCLPPNNVAAMKYALVNKGPISVACNAGLFSFMHYSEGVFDEPACDGRNLDHAMLVIGYGVSDEKDYWILKNSWGSKWGDKGYMKIRTNQCGVSQFACYPNA